MEIDESKLARVELGPVLRRTPRHPEANLLLARLYLESDPDKAVTHAAAIPEDSEGFEMAGHIRRLSRMARWGHQGTIELEPDAPKSEDTLQLYRSGAIALAEGRYTDTLDSWIELLTRDRKLDDEGARKNCIALFALLGEDSEVTQVYRRKFSSALF